MIERVRPQRKRRRPNRKAFNDLWIERLKPKDKQVLYWDAGCRGLSMLVSPGGTKTFRSMYKLNGKWCTRTIGRFGEMSAADDEDEADVEIEDAEVVKARAVVRRDRALAKEGEDPKHQRAATPKQITFEFVVGEFIEKYAKRRQHTWDQTERVLLRNCERWLKRPIGQITKAQAEDLIEEFITAGHHSKARVTLAWLTTLFGWAWKKDYIAHNIMDKVEVEIEQQVRERVYTDDEVKAIWHAADTLDPIEAGYIKLLILLAPRKTELAGMRRSEIEFDDGDNPVLWTTPHERTKSKKTAKKKRVYKTPLPPLAQRIIMSLPKRHDDLVFPGRGNDIPIWPGSPLKRKLVKAGAPEDFAYHTMRHTISTWLEDEGRDEFETGLVLNHSGGVSISSNYRHGFAAKLKLELLTEWADHVEGLVTPKGAVRLS